MKENGRSFLWQKTAFFYDLITDSIFIPRKALKEVYEDGHDSLFAVELFKEMFGSLKNYLLSFNKDSVCLESESARTKGTYQISNSKDSIDLFIQMASGKPPEHLHYYYIIKNNVLILTIPIANYYRRLVLEKQ